MALTLAVDRIASIEVLKNIQSLAFSVQRYLEQTPETHCARCGKNKNSKKKGTKKLSSFRPFRMRNISSTAWNRRFCSGYSPLKENRVNSPTKQDPVTQNTQTQSEPSPTPFEPLSTGVQFGVTIESNNTGQDLGSATVVDDDNEGTRVKVEENVESPPINDISDPRLSESPSINDRPTTNTTSGQEQSTTASEILKSLASRTKTGNNASTVLTEPLTSESEPPAERNTSSLPSTAATAATATGWSPMTSAAVAATASGWSPMTSTGVAAAAATPATATTSPPSLPTAKRNSASDILKSIASSFAYKRAKLPPTDDSESLIRDDVDIHVPPTSSPSSSPTTDFSSRKSRPSSDILKSILESIPGETDLSRNVNRSFAENLIKRERSQDEERLLLSPSSSMHQSVASAANTFGGNSKSMSTMFSYPSTNPFNVGPSLPRVDDPSLLLSSSSLTSPLMSVAGQRTLSSFDNFAMTPSGEMTSHNGNQLISETYLSTNVPATHLFSQSASAQYSSTLSQSQDHGWKIWDHSKLGEKRLHTEAYHPTTSTGSGGEGRSCFPEDPIDRDATGIVSSNAQPMTSSYLTSSIDFTGSVRSQSGELAVKIRKTELQ